MILEILEIIAEFIAFFCIMLAVSVAISAAREWYLHIKDNQKKDEHGINK